jgi:hypothetical protein
MTERWRKKLRDLDASGPTQEVFDRAKTGPSRTDDGVDRPSTGTRIVTGLVAFALFALAVSVFLVPALRMNSKDAQSGSLGMFPIWPAQDADALAALQQKADAGEADWLLAPSSVAERFGSEVLHWPRTLVDPMSSKYCSPNQQLWEPNWQGATPSGPPTCASAVEPTPDAAAPTPVVGDFPLVSLGHCDGDVCVFGGQSLQLFQPGVQGTGGIWAVLQASTPGLNLSVTPGQRVHDGATISADVTPRDLIGSAPTLAYSTCGSDQASSGSTSTTWGIGGAMSLDVHLQAHEGCEGEQPGIAWIADADPGLGGTGTFAGDQQVPEHHSIEYMTAAPVVMVFPAGDTSPGPPSSSESGGVTPKVYSDPYGWSVVVPEGWNVDRTSANVNEGATLSGLAAGTEVSVSIMYIEPGYVATPAYFTSPHDDSALPLDPSALEPGEGGPRMWFMVGGNAIQIKVGSRMTLDADAQAVVDDIIRSVTFEPWEVGDDRNGFTAIGKVHAASSAEWFYAVTGDGENAFSTYVDGERMLYGPVYSCPGARYEVREYGVAAMVCADGSDNAWDFKGRPQPGNSPDYAHQLDGFPAIRSWEGYLLVDLRPAAT